MATCVVAPPAVPLIESRARFCLSAAHTKENIDEVRFCLSAAHTKENIDEVMHLPSVYM